MVQQFLAHSFMLNEHAVYGHIAQELLNNLAEKTPQRWTIVCERKEDLLSIRTQLFSLLKKRHKESGVQGELDAWAGVSLYTPDSLVRNFALTLSHNSAHLMGAQNSTLLRSPFLDVVEQERLTRLLLLQLGYAGSDVAPLAKQILTLSDTELPPDESFLSVLLEVQKMNVSLRNLSDIPDLSLRTICVAYQLLQKINSSFCRLQSFVGQYWLPHFKTHLRAWLEQEEGFAQFLHPRRILEQPLLWVAAPEYTQNENPNATRAESNYRPGNFQAYWIDALRNVLFDAREMCASVQKTLPQPQPTLWARTVIAVDIEPPVEAPSAQVHIFGSQAALEHSLRTEEERSPGGTLFLLGDVNARSWNLYRTDGSGVHSLSPADFGSEEHHDSPHDQAADAALEEWRNPAGERVEKLRDEFKRDWQRIEKFFPWIDQALENYGLSSTARRSGVGMQLLMHRFFDSESFSVGELDGFSRLPPALSLLPGLAPVKEICVVGSPHSTTAPSFHLRILNAVFYHLRSRHIALDPIASELAYRGYWQSMLMRSEPIRFMLKSHKEFSDFPDYSKPWCQAPIAWNTGLRANQTSSAFERWLSHTHCIEDSAWRRLLSDPRKRQSTELAVTAFEDYVECPLQYYWLHLHRTELENHPALQPDRLSLGQRAHALAETFFRSLRHLCVLDDTQQRAHLWHKVISAVCEEFIGRDAFLAADRALWQSQLTRTLFDCGLNDVQQKHTQSLAEELAQLIFSADLEQSTSHESAFSGLRKSLTREAVRRSMKKLLESELLLLGQVSEETQTHRVGEVRAAFLEEQITFPLHPSLLLSGRIDRIDTHPDGDKIIDYKTSKVPKNEVDLVLLPSALNSTRRLSVQGALYSLAWAHRQGQDESLKMRGVRRFSLMRLKTLDLSRNPELAIEFATPLRFESEDYLNILSEYRPYAQSLSEGLFPATPLQKEHCQTCALNNCCPVAQQNEGRTQ